MKSVIIAAGASIFLSSLSVAFPAQLLSRDARTVNIQAKTGDGDASVGFSITVGELNPTTSAGMPLESLSLCVANFYIALAQAQKAVNAEVDDDGVFCQAFSDNAGTIELGPVFTSKTGPASFTNSSSGDVSSSADQAVPVGAYCCVTSADGFGACSGSGSGTGSSSTQTVRVEAFGENELAEQSEVPLDNSVFRFAGRFDTAQIINVEGAKNPKCTAFSDVLGDIAVGKPFSTDLTTLGKAVIVQSLRCSA